MSFAKSDLVTAGSLCLPGFFFHSFRRFFPKLFAIAVSTALFIRFDSSTILRSISLRTNALWTCVVCSNSSSDHPRCAAK